MQADKRRLIESETHETISAGDYILGRIRSNFEANFAAKEKASKEEAGASGEQSDGDGGAPKRARKA